MGANPGMRLGRFETGELSAGWFLGGKRLLFLFFLLLLSKSFEKEGE